MFKLAIASFALLNVGFAASAVTPDAPVAAGVPGSDTTNLVFILETCNEINLGAPCATWSSSTVPSNCVNLTTQNNTISSVRTPAGIFCILYADPGCSGASQRVGGTINDLRPLDFNDLASSFQCAST